MLSAIGKPLNTLFSWYLEKRMLEIDRFKNDPFGTQEKTLHQLIQVANKTKFGSQYDFQSIKNPHQFKNKVPLHQYSDLELLINEMKNGKPNILWPGQIKWFAQSSGTSNKVIKHIPISKQSLKDCHYKGGKDLLSIYYNQNPNTQLFTGKHLIVGGASSAFINNKKTVIGDLSAIIMEQLPWWCEWRRSPNGIKKVLADNWKDKLKYIIDSSIKDDIHILSLIHI